MDIVYPNLNLVISSGNLSMQVLSASYFQIQKSISAHYHGNGCYEIHYIPSGKGWARIDDTLYELSPGMLYITGPYVNHAQTSDPEDPMMEYSLYFKLSDQKSADSDLSFNSPEAQAVFTAFMNYPFWIGQDSQSLQPQLQHFLDELAQCRFGFELRAKAILLQILVSIVRNYQDISRPSSLGLSALSASAEQQAPVIIERYFLTEYRDLTLEELCSRLHLSPRQTERLLQKLYGKNFSQKKAESRMSAAVMLLTETDLSIAQIAEELGYASAPYFSSAFRSYFKVSPNYYRKQQSLASTSQ